jgi:integrase
MKTESNKIKFTKTALKNLPAPATGRAYYHNSEQKGLLLQVTAAGTKSFQAYKRVNGVPVRVTLGKFPEMSVEAAEKAALEQLNEMVKGVNPNAKEKDDAKAKTTLKTVFADYLAARKSLKSGTIKDYTRLLEIEAFPDWLDLPLKNLTRDKVQKRHTELGEKSEARANNAMRVLRALFNFAIGQYEDSEGIAIFTDNPVRKISHAKSWYTVDRRTTVIKVSELATWFNAVHALTAQDGAQALTVRDYLLLLLFTGLRREEAARLEWTDINWIEKTLLVKDTKNKIPLILPLSDFLFDLLKRRESFAVNHFVFGNLKTKSGRIEDPKKLIYKLRESTGIFFNPHDLRRTFATLVERLDVPAYAIKRLLNHKINGDITAGYIIMDVERLRKPMQQVTDFILKEVGIKESSEVIKLVKNNT